jgi:hypothetical protein
MRRFTLLVVLLGALFIAATPARQTAAAQRCFTETNQCIDGRIAQFWAQNGGLPVFGYPIGPQETTTIDGQVLTSQRFERTRLELHPENAAPYDVLLGRMGVQRLAQQGRDWFTFPKSGDTGGCRVFAETGHSVCGAFLTAWRAHGLQMDTDPAVSDAESLGLFGMPLSGVLTERLTDGQLYQVQWFERARFELHPENPAPYNVLLGLLGNEIAQATPNATAPTSAVTVAATPVPGAGLSEDEKRARIKDMPNGYWTTEFENITLAVGNATYMREYYNAVAGTGKRFVRLSIAVNNRRTAPQDVILLAPARLTLVDYDGRIYSVDAEATRELKNALVPVNAYPGRMVGGDVFFKIPTSTAPALLLYRYDVNKPTVVLNFDPAPYR